MRLRKNCDSELSGPRKAYPIRRWKIKRDYAIRSLQFIADPDGRRAVAAFEGVRLGEPPSGKARLSGVIAISPAMERSMLNETDYDELKHVDTFCVMAFGLRSRLGRSRRSSSIFDSLSEHIVRDQ
jgi:hypothetical protein